MPTTMAVGHAGTGSAEEQARAAATEARERLGSDPILGLVFTTSKHDVQVVASTVASILGDAPFIGCSTAGEFADDRISAGGTAVALIASDQIGISVGVAQGLKKNTPRAVAQLVGQLNSNRGVVPNGAKERSIFLLSDGMAGNGEGLVDALAVEVGASVSITGGAAGDDAAFVETEVFLNGQVLKDAVVAAELTSTKKIGVGVYHGWCAASEPGKVTAAEGGRLIAIDDQPAIEFYQRYATKIGFELTPENQNEFVVTHELGMVLRHDELKVRAPLSVNEDGSINCATEVPVGQQVRVVEGDHDAIVAAARRAAEHAVSELGGQTPAGAIVFDCVARKLVLGDDFVKEVAAFKDVIKGPFLGFNTYGEMAKVRGQLSGFHNTTAVVAVLPA